MEKEQALEILELSERLVNKRDEVGAENAEALNMAIDALKEKAVKRTERGWAGHFILGDKCRFRRNTLLEYGDRKWIVSTVGNLVAMNPLTQNREVMEIGHQRWYETMAFEATDKVGYLDADVSKEIAFESEWGIWDETWHDVIEKYPQIDDVANNMHEKVVAELTRKIREVEHDKG